MVKKPYRREMLLRALQLFNMFQGGPVTSDIIAKEFNCTRQTANRWIRDASIVWPIYEAVGKYDNGSVTNVVYRWLGD